MKIERLESPNHNERLAPLDMLVLHYTGMETGEAACDRLIDPAAGVSAHYLVWEDGRISQLVDEDRRAWHAGVSSWSGQGDLNSRSIGIEIVNGGHDFPGPGGVLPPYPEAQIGAVVDLCRAILARHPIPQTRVVGHSDIAPERKIDPGEHFPWARLASEGVGLWLPALDAVSSQVWAAPLAEGAVGASVQRLQGALASIGYATGAPGRFDLTLAATVRAFQRRFLPAQITGQADPVTLTRIVQIADLYGTASRSASPG